MKLNWDAPRLFVTPMQLVGVRSNFFAVFSKSQFLPVCQYPLSAPSPQDHEVGAIVKIDKRSNVTKVLRRVICLSGKVKR